MNRFSKFLALGVLAFGVSLTSCEKEEVINTNNNLGNDESFVLEDAKNGDLIPGQYIVVLKETSSVAKKSAGFSSYEESQDAMRAYASSLLSSKKSSESTLQRVYSSAIQGFSVKMDDVTLKSLQANPDVAYIEQDRVIRIQKNVAVMQPMATSKKATSLPWGIKRVNGGEQYTGDNQIWIVDTGIDLDHTDLDVQTALYFDGFGSNGDDDNGHGTHCAGIAAAKSNGVNYTDSDGNWDVTGVAAGAPVVPIKVFNSNGGGSVSIAVDGIDHVAGKAKAGDVANMSFGFPAKFWFWRINDAMDDAVTRLISKGVKVAVAAGNSREDANNSTPSRMMDQDVYVVASSAEGDIWSSFSNYGESVDCIAPGSYILSTYMGGGYATLSGTSMAAPHVAGLLLLGNGTLNTEGNINGYPVATR